MINTAGSPNPPILAAVFPLCMLFLCFAFLPFCNFPIYIIGFNCLPLLFNHFRQIVHVFHFPRRLNSSWEHRPAFFSFLGNKSLSHWWSKYNSGNNFWKCQISTNMVAEQARGTVFQNIPQQLAMCQITCLARTLDRSNGKKKNILARNVE